MQLVRRGPYWVNPGVSGPAIQASFVERAPGSARACNVTSVRITTALAVNINVKSWSAYTVLSATNAKSAVSKVEITDRGSFGRAFGSLRSNLVGRANRAPKRGVLSAHCGFQ